MYWSALPLVALRAALIVAGLLVPGACLVRSLRLPTTPLTAYLAGSVAIYAGVLLLTATGLPVTLLSLGLCLAAVALAAEGWSRFTLLPRAPREETDAFDHFTWLGGWTPLYALFWLVAAWRLGTQPLTGPDVGFRWDFLAQQLAATGSLDFYPPRRAADFLQYFWAESIPPGIASLYAWTHLAGGPGPLWTMPVVLLQLLSVYELVWRLAHSWGGTIAARWAVLLAAATPLLTWAILIGQETGQTAVAAGALLWALLRWHKTKADRWVYFAALAAAAGAATREYGLVYPLLGYFLLRLAKAPDYVRLRYHLIAWPLALAWPLRVWWLTGNPLYSLSPGGWLPGNPVFALWTEHFRAAYGSSLTSAEGLRSALRYFALMALPALPACIALAVHAARGLREARWCGVFVVVFGGLWVASVPFTAGGLFYAMRVLSPVFLLSAAFGGYALLALGLGPKAKRIVQAGIIGLFAATLPHTLTLPQNAYRLEPREWPAAGRAFSDGVAAAEAELRAKLAPLPHGGQVLTESAGMTRALAPIGVKAVPVWSPAVAWLFDAVLPPDEIARRWNETKLRYLLITKSPADIAFLNQNARWKPPYFTLKQILETNSYLIFEVTANPAAGGAKPE